MPPSASSHDSGANPIGAADERCVQPIGIVVHVEGDQTLLAREAGRGRVLVIRAEALDATVGHLGHQAASDLAQPAERPVDGRRHRVPLTPFTTPRRERGVVTPLARVPDVLVLAPTLARAGLGRDLVVAPAPEGDAVPAEHARVGEEHLTRLRDAGGMQGSAELVDAVDDDRGRAPLVVAGDGSLARRQQRPHAVADEEPAGDAIATCPVGLAPIDRDGQERVGGRLRPVAVADLRLRSVAAQPP